MYLKSLEVQGFKSFADKTLVSFDNDITAIVGPNGSGKSNISDAIRWVMGEMSSKELRGTRMEDVIFGGTQKRSPLGFAEATLTLDNSDGAFKIDAPEVAVTRRYYRSGESEYYINRQSARLRDIVELFMDTGLGREGYSNIGQGRIDEIVSLKSTDRREIFEEAAGISKYRHRKEETERRLANTEDNLLRIGDKISELELQVNPLREQAEKAKKYLGFREELKGLEITVWLETLTKLAAARKKAEDDYHSAAFILEQAHNEIDRLYAQAEEQNQRLNQMNQQADEKRSAISAAEGNLQEKNAEMTVLQASRQNVEENLRRVRSEMEDHEQRADDLRVQISAQQERIRVIAAELEQARGELDKALSESTAAEQAGTILRSKGDDLRTRSARLLSEISGKKAEVATLMSSVGDVLERKKILEEDKTAAAARLSETEEKAAECAKRLSDANENIVSAKNTISGYALRQKAREERRDGLRKIVEDLEIEQKTVRSRYGMMQEMQREFEGFSKAVKIIMQEKASGHLQGIIGPISQIIRVEDRYTVAIETALGAAMQNIVVTSRDAAKAGIRLLNRCGGGRATFAPMDAMIPHKLQERGVENARGFIGIASELADCDPKYENILSNLLGRTVIAENLDAASDMARQFSSRFKIVTLDGQVMNAGGSMTGGSASKSAGILSRANALKKLEEQNKELEEKLIQRRRELDEASRAAEEVAYQLADVQNQLRQSEDAVLRLEGEKKQFDILLEALRENIAGYDRDLRLIETKNGSEELRLRVLRQEIESAEAANAALELDLQSAGEEQTAFSEKEQSLSDRITDLRLRLASGDAECETARQNIAQMTALSNQMNGDRSQKDLLIGEYEAELQKIDDQISAGKIAVTDAEKLVEQAQEDLRKFLEQRSQVEILRTKADKSAQEKNREILQMEREAARLEQKKATSELEENQIIDKLWDSYELTRSTASEFCVEISSLAEAQRRITELRRKISALGTPNLGAIDEFERVNERYGYLTGQRDDVLHAKKELEEIVNSITKEMREIFLREFARINQCFAETFLEMFGGGKASLELENEEEPLSCGIEIKVQPPGKQLKTITLLSGGEKAFVAIALYFAILKVRPASFCLLDEIDAALDDNNVARFAGYLRNLSDKTQFIVITHRRGTMETADALYGVTMQEKGVSRLLHIDLNQMDQQLRINE